MFGILRLDYPIIMHIMKPFFILSFLLLIIGCKPDPKIPKWDVEALTPLVSSRLDIRDILADSSLSVTADGELSVVYQNKLATLKPNEIIEPLNATFKNVIKLSDISLGNPTINDAISLGFLAKGGTPAGQFIIFNNGKKAIIPPFNSTNKKAFTVDATKFFQSINLITGDLKIELYNDLPIMLTDIEFDLKNKSSGTILLQKSIDTLRSQQTYSETISLNGQTIEGQLTTTLKKLGTPGSGSDSLVIDTSRKIFITVSLDNLTPSSATAIFPDQILANDTADTEIKTGNAQMTRVKVKGGSMFLNATSTIEDQISLNYIIPGANLNGTQLRLDESIPAASPPNTSSKTTSLSLSGYEIDMTGRPLYSNVYNTFYTILMGKIDSSGNLITLSLQDSVLLETGINDLTANEGYGYLGKDTTESNEVNKVSLFTELAGSDFDLASARMQVEFRNHIGAPIDIRVDQLLASNASTPQSISGSNSTALSWDDLGGINTIPAATLSGRIPQPSYLLLNLDETNSNLDQLIETNPQFFKTEVVSFMNGSLNTPDYNQFIFSDYGIDTYLNLEIPMHFSAKDIHITDSITFDYANLDKDGQLQKGALKLIAKNHFPFGGTIDLFLVNDLGERVGTLTSADLLESATVDANGKSITEIKSVLEYPLTAQQVDVLKNTSHIVIDVHLNTPNPDQKVKLYDSDYLDLTLSGDLTIRTK